MTHEEFFKELQELMKKHNCNCIETNIDSRYKYCADDGGTNDDSANQDVYRIMFDFGHGDFLFFDQIYQNRIFGDEEK